MVALATIVAMLMANAAASAAADTPLSVIVTDARTQSLVLIDANSGQERGRLSVPPGQILYPREPSRLVVFSRAPDGSELASVVGRDPFRIVASVPLGTRCQTSGLALDDASFGRWLLRTGPLQSADGRRISVLCGGRMVSVDLITAATSSLELAVASAAVYALPDDRALLVSRTESGSDILFVDSVWAPSHPDGAPGRDSARRLRHALGR